MRLLASILAAMILAGAAWSQESSSASTDRDQEWRALLHQGVRPANFYALDYVWPDDAQLCRRFLAIMNEEFTLAPWENQFGGDFPIRGHALFLGSPNPLEPWTPRVLTNKWLDPKARHFLGFREADINHDGAPDRIYRARFGGDHGDYNGISVRLGRPGETYRVDESDVFVLWSGQNSATEYLELADPRSWTPGRYAGSYEPRGTRSAYSMIDIDSSAYLISAYPEYPGYQPVRLSLINFTGDRPYIACGIASTFVDPPKK